MGGVVLVILVIISLFAGFRIGKLYFDNESIKNELDPIGDSALTQRDYDTKKNILSLLASYEVSVKPDDISVDFNERRDHVTISFRYERSADLIVMKQPLHFHLSVQREAQKGVGMLQGVQESLDGAAQNTGQRYENAVKQGVNAGGGLPSTDQ